jgi:SAM-dependent methyltransferase
MVIAKDSADAFNDPCSPDLRRPSWSDGSVARLTCRACGSNISMSHVVTTEHVFRGNPSPVFYRCSECASLNTQLDVFTDYDEDSAFLQAPAFSRHYIQIGAGIDFMIRPLQQSCPSPGATMIDVGCGFGFTVDFWNWLNPGGGCGLEPSYYGRLGKDMLSANIENDYLHNVTEFNSRTYDRVFSSEVIEHVDDIDAFIAELSGVLAPAGVMILTTPNADFVRSENPLSIVLAVLSPGLHRVLFSAKALKSALARAGFEHIDVRVANERLVAFASHVPLRVVSDPAAERQQYTTYLGAALAKARDPDLAMGLLFRHFEEEVNQGNISSLEPTWSRLCQLAEADYGLDLRDFDAVVRHRDIQMTFEEYVEKVPLILAPALYYAAMATLNGVGLLPSAKSGFLAAAETALHFVELTPNFSQKAASIYWWARLHAAIAAIKEGDHAMAQRQLEIMITASMDANPLIPVEPNQLLRARREYGVSLLQSGYPERAMGELRLVLRSSSGDIRADAEEIYRVSYRQAMAEVRGLVSGISSL